MFKFFEILDSKLCKSNPDALIVFGDQKDEYEIVKSKLIYLWNEHLNGKTIILPVSKICSGLANIQLHSPKINQLICRFYASVNNNKGQ